VVAPGWSWHDHGNLGSEPVIWMDGLDLPFAQFFGAHFREEHADDVQAVASLQGDAQAKPAVLYRYERVWRELEGLARSGAPHPSHGYRLRYANPAGGEPFPTIAAFLQRLPAGFSGATYRSTECAVFNVAEGSGSVHIGETRFEFCAHDIFVVPSWTAFRISAGADCVLFSYSDRAAQEILGFWREQPEA